MADETDVPMPTANSDMKAKEASPPPSAQNFITMNIQTVTIQNPIVFILVPGDYEQRDKITEKIQKSAVAIAYSICYLISAEPHYCFYKRNSREDVSRAICETIMNEMVQNKAKFDSLLLIIHGHGTKYNNNQYLEYNDEVISIDSIMYSISDCFSGLINVPKILITGMCSGRKTQGMRFEYKKNRNPKELLDNDRVTKPPATQPTTEALIGSHDKSHQSTLNLSKCHTYQSGWLILRAADDETAKVIQYPMGKVTNVMQFPLSTATLISFFYCLKWSIENDHDQEIDNLTEYMSSLIIGENQIDNNDSKNATTLIRTPISQLLRKSTFIAKATNRMKRRVGSPYFQDFSGQEIILVHPYPSNHKEKLKEIFPLILADMIIHEDDTLDWCSILAHDSHRSTVKFDSDFTEMHHFHLERASKMVTESDIMLIQNYYVEHNVKGWVSQNSISMIFFANASDWYSEQKKAKKEMHGKELLGIRRRHLMDATNIICSATHSQPFNDYINFKDYVDIMIIWFVYLRKLILVMPYVAVCIKLHHHSDHIIQSCITHQFIFNLFVYRQLLTCRLVWSLRESKALHAPEGVYFCLCTEMGDDVKASFCLQYKAKKWDINIDRKPEDLLNDIKYIFDQNSLYRPNKSKVHLTGRRKRYYAKSILEIFQTEYKKSTKKVTQDDVKNSKDFNDGDINMNVDAENKNDEQTADPFDYYVDKISTSPTGILREDYRFDSLAPDLDSTDEDDQIFYLYSKEDQEEMWEIQNPILPAFAPMLGPKFTKPLMIWEEFVTQCDGAFVKYRGYNQGQILQLTNKICSNNCQLNVFKCKLLELMKNIDMTAKQLIKSNRGTFALLVKQFDKKLLKQGCALYDEMVKDIIIEDPRLIKGSEKKMRKSKKVFAQKRKKPRSKSYDNDAEDAESKSSEVFLLNDTSKQSSLIHLDVSTNRGRNRNKSISLMTRSKSKPTLTSSTNSRDNPTRKKDKDVSTKRFSYKEAGEEWVNKFVGINKTNANGKRVITAFVEYGPQFRKELYDILSIMKSTNKSKNYDFDPFMRYLRPVGFYLLKKQYQEKNGVGSEQPVPTITNEIWQNTGSDGWIMNSSILFNTGDDLKVCDSMDQCFAAMSSYLKMYLCPICLYECKTRWNVKECKNCDQCWGWD